MIYNIHGLARSSESRREPPYEDGTAQQIQAINTASLGCLPMRDVHRTGTWSRVRPGFTIFLFHPRTERGNSAFNTQQRAQMTRRTSQAKAVVWHRMSCRFGSACARVTA